MSQLASAQLGTLAFKIRPCPQRALYLTAQSHSKFLHCSITRRTPPVVGRYLWKIRGFNTSAVRWHGEIVKPQPGTGIKLTFRDSKGNDIKTVEGNEGDDILSLAHEYDVDLEGACEGSVACSTCHVIVDPAHFDILPEADDEENDMLDLAFGLEDTSVIHSCLILITEQNDNIGVLTTLASYQSAFTQI
nr:adrenodoxin-type ferredoxin [Cryptococcus depauperatus CBS 7841]